MNGILYHIYISLFILDTYDLERTGTATFQTQKITPCFFNPATRWFAVTTFRPFFPWQAWAMKHFGSVTLMFRPENWVDFFFGVLNRRKVAPKTSTSGILNGYLLIILISHIIHVRQVYLPT